MSFGEKLTHIIAGDPSENEIKELRNLAALGVIHVVKSGWLEDWDSENKEVPVLRKHIAYDLLLPKDPIHCSKGAAISTSMKRHGKSYVHTMSPDEHAWRSTYSGCAMPSEKSKELEKMKDVRISLRENGVQHQPYASNRKDEFKILNESSCAVNGRIPSSVFEGRRFCFSASFPVDRRADIVEWVNQGGGVVVEDQNETNVHFIVECHGICAPRKMVLRLLLYLVTGLSLVWRMDACWIHLCEWIYECIRQNKFVCADPFYSKEVTSEYREAGVCTTSQFPTQAVRMTSGDTASQPQTQPQLINVRIEGFAGKNLTGSTKEGSSAVPDVAAAIEDLLEQTSKFHDQKSPSRSECDEELFASGSNTLAQGDGDHHATLGLSNHWTNRFEKKDETHSHSGDATANVYDHFSETQTDSQVVGYAEDLSGRQMIIDRVRTGVLA
ncbi:hypothetical protein K7X08_010141 [Anisodus acutangulus]|uniref:BRCT domain-containing protein n=1 Tax=Anisodus acutangulus TaxID=402998 RepID=A0A9Q1N157_9SOLA|nr:hypothetical protein K7X08_010141 [Anisodus acutangulus]